MRMKAYRRLHLQVLGLLLSSALLLTFIQPPFYGAFLAWIALVPLALAATRPLAPRALMGWAALSGFLYWLVNLYWLVPITPAGWIALCLYLALLWALAALALQYCHWRHWPLTPCLALIWMGAEQCQGIFLGGFYWRFLAHSQFLNLPLIQIADLLGAAAVSFLIAWINGFCAELALAALHKRFSLARFRTSGLVVLGLLVATLVYGHWRLAQGRRLIQPGPRAGIVQSNIPQHVKESFKASDQILTDLLELSGACAAHEVDLIVWPETMIQGILDETVWSYLANEEYVAQCQAQDRMLKEHARNQAYLLVGTYGGTIRFTDSGEVKLDNFNSANLFRPDGTRDPARYDKIKPLLFGERLPFKGTWPQIHKLILALTPYDYDYTLDAGTDYTVFELNAPVHPDVNRPETRTYRFGVIICYEDTLPELSRRFARPNTTGKGVDWLVNISNDGWFVRFNREHQEVTPSAELPQHVASCVFRAVENRLAVLRSVNTGISCLIAPSGALHQGYEQASDAFPSAPLERQGVAGWFTDTIPIDPRITLFSRWGSWPNIVGRVGFLGVVLLSAAGVGRTARRIRFSRSST